MKNGILYSFRRCPYAIRVRWALLICEIKVELREIDLKKKPLDFLNKSRTKTVPVLIRQNNEIIEESLDIILWALSVSKKKNIINKYIPDNKKEKIFEIINENDNQFKYHLDRFKYSTRFINRWDELLKKTRFLFGDNHTIADWCIWPFVRQFKIACESQKKIKFFQPTMQKWLEYFENHKNFTDLMYKYSLWEPSSKTNYFPIN